MTISHLGMRAQRRQSLRMSELAEALSLSSLVAGSLEYAILIRHREERRRSLSWLDEWEKATHEALTRVNQPVNRWQLRRWTAEGTRFRMESAWPWAKGRNERG
jgi:hypothetical protein